MKIGLLSSSLSSNGGGVYEVIKNLYTNLSAMGITTNVIGANDDNFNIAEWSYSAPLVYKVQYLRAFGYSSELWSLLKRANTDILHIHGLWMYNQFLAYHYSKRQGTPLIISPHGMLDAWSLERSVFKKKVVSCLFGDGSLKHAKCIHALNLSEYESIRNLGIKTPVAIIPNGIDLPVSDYLLTQTAYKKKDERIMLYIGRLHPKKGLVNFLKAVHILKQKDEAALINWKIKIAGWEQLNHLAEVNKLCNKYELWDVVEIMGPVFGKEKQEALQNADLFFLPSYSEGLPMTILEAWSHKLPVLMTKQCNLPEGFCHDAAIEIYTNPEDIALQLQRVLRFSKEQLSSIGKNGYDLVRERYTWQKVSSKMIEMYRWILDEVDKPDFVVLD